MIQLTIKRFQGGTLILRDHFAAKYLKKLESDFGVTLHKPGEYTAELAADLPPEAQRKLVETKKDLAHDIAAELKRRKFAVSALKFRNICADYVTDVKAGKPTGHDGKKLLEKLMKLPLLKGKRTATQGKTRVVGAGKRTVAVPARGSLPRSRQ